MSEPPEPSRDPSPNAPSDAAPDAPSAAAVSIPDELPIAKPNHPLTTIPDDGSPVPQDLVATAGLDAPHTSGTILMEPLPATLQETSANGSSNETPAPPKTPSRLRVVAHKVVGSLRHVGLALAISVAIFLIFWQVNQHYAIKHWLFWMYAKIWGYCALFALASISSGHLAITALGGKRLPLLERSALSLAAGTLIFFLVMFVCGLLGIYNRVFAIVMPIVLAAPGLWSLFRHSRRVVHHLRGARKRTTWRPSALFWIIAAFGMTGIGLIYFAILSPRNIAYDSYFYHLGIAQQYALEGGIGKALEGWLPAAIPHLASVLYTWAFLLPGMSMFERVVCAAHVEFVVFLFTLVGVPALVRKLVPQASAGLSWAAFFLFPGIFVYDSALSVAADHIGALWAIPAYLMTLRALRSLDVRADGGSREAARNFGLLAAFLAGGILTKYQGMYLAVFPAITLSLAIFWYFLRALWRRQFIWPTLRTILIGSSTAIVIGLVLTMPHWLKNFVWYGDPFFPYLNKYFHSPQWSANVGEVFDVWNEQTKNWKPQGSTIDKLRETAQGMTLFAFQPHDWAKFHGRVPIFGFLFTMSALFLPFLRKTKRIWMLFVATEMGVGIWYWTLHQDRYLQLLLPWMACVVAATLILLWRAHWTAKPLTAAIVGLQVVWGADTYFIPAHAMTGTSAAPVTIELLSMGMKGKQADRYAFGDRLFEIGRDPVLPQNAKVLLHEWETRLGLWRPMISDFPGHMYAFQYEQPPSPVEFDKRIRALGVTHIISRSQKSGLHDSIGADLQFFAYVERDTQLLKKIGEWGIHALRPKAPTRNSNNIVAYLACGKQYERGLHKLVDMSVRDRFSTRKIPQVKAMKPLIPTSPDYRGIVQQADYLVTDAKCTPPIPADTTQGFMQVATRDSEALWVRVR